MSENEINEELNEEIKQEAPVVEEQTADGEDHAPMKLNYSRKKKHNYTINMFVCLLSLITIKGAQQKSVLH